MYESEEHFSEQFIKGLHSQSSLGGRYSCMWRSLSFSELDPYMEAVGKGRRNPPKRE